MRASIVLAIASAISFGNVLATPTPAKSSAPSAPTVDLGYALHRGTINETGKTYNFSNIRYAAPPTGNLRFQAPTPPQGKNRTVNDGQQLATCPQAAAAWGIVALQFLSGAPLTTLAAELAVLANTTLAQVPAAGPSETEDCLFLDVIVPQAIYQKKKAKAPVLVWIYGGGYTGGSKTNFNPSGLISQSQKDGSDGVIYVALNYRLGLFGWLSGPTFQESGTPNAGLYDQRLALQWVQTNIHLFGGDPDRVTIMGESAGAGSIMHQITAYGGGGGKVPFQQAIPQSAAWGPLPTNEQQESIFNTVLKFATLASNTSITSVAQLKALPSSILQKVNSIVVILSSYGTYTFGPAVDGDFVPALPGLLLLHGKFHRDVKLMIGHNSNETLPFTNPLVQTAADFKTFLIGDLPAATPAVIDYIETVLYPPVFDGSLGYWSEFGRASVALAENAFTCNTRYLAHAFGNKTYNYFFTVPPGLHGEDIAYTFFNGDTTTSNDGLPVRAAVATQLQSYITNFVSSGNPNTGNKVPKFPTYGSASQVLNIDYAGAGLVTTDSLVSGRCEWWQKALYA